MQLHQDLKMIAANIELPARENITWPNETPATESIVYPWNQIRFTSGGDVAEDLIYDFARISTGTGGRVACLPLTGLPIGSTLTTIEFMHNIDGFVSGHAYAYLLSNTWDATDAYTSETLLDGIADTAGELTLVKRTVTLAAPVTITAGDVYYVKFTVSEGSNLSWDVGNVKVTYTTAAPLALTTH